MARPITYDRQAVLDKATDLFWQQGYEATSLADVLRVTGFNRHSLYKEFNGKEGLYLEALRNYDQTFTSCIGGPLRSSDGGLDAIRNMFDVRMPADVTGKGCLMTSTLNEREYIPERACDYADGFTDRLEDALHHAIQVAQQQGDVPASKDPRALATYVVYVMQGLGVMSKRGITRNEIHLIRDQTLTFLQA